MGALKDPFIADSINKLVAAGVVKMGWEIIIHILGFYLKYIIFLEYSLIIFFIFKF